MEKQEKSDSFIKDYSDNKSNIKLKKLDGYPYYPIGRGASIFSGYAFKSKDFCDHGIPVIKIKNVNDRTVNLNDTQFIPECKLTSKTEKYILEDKDVLIAMTGQGSVGRVGQIRTNNNFLLNQRVGKFVVDEKNLNRDYLFHVISSPQYEKILFDAGHGSGQPNLSPDTIKSIEIPYPPYEEQVVIGRILSTLDAKIELNRQMNSTLEQIAQTLFKHWFIDFEFPDENGNPYKSSGGRMDDSELGEIPEGWEVKKIGKILELAYGKALKEEIRIPGSIPVYGSNGQVGWHNQKLVDGPGIVIGRKGNPGIITWVHTSFYPIDTTFYVVPKGQVKSLYYLLHVLKKQNLPSLAADSAVPGLNRNMVYMNKIIIPKTDVLDLFNIYLNNIYQKIQVNEEKSRVLGLIRDSLLPKLMSGKIRVPVAEGDSTCAH